ncbi:MAG: class I SAM-dependent methyltransferase [Candidatus Cloacimonetes bacterium]|nr:class I SAM-dependent methyltransferase [Candidatus Cloacimonadota bacterium]
MRNFDYESYYQKVAPIYDTVRLDKKNEFNSTLAIVLKNCKIDTTHILDIGCGSGRYAQALSERGFEVIGVDKSKSQLEQASKIINTRHCDASNLPFDNNSFDICTMMSVIHQMSDAERYTAFNEVFRVLKINGCFIIKTCSHGDLKNRLTSSFWPKTLENDLLRYPTIDKIKDELIKFTDINTKRTETKIELPKNECLEEYRLRKSSNLGMLDDSEFLTGIQLIEKTYLKHKSILKRNCHTFLIAHKNSN